MRTSHEAKLDAIFGRNGRDSRVPEVRARLSDREFVLGADGAISNNPGDVRAKGKRISAERAFHYVDWEGMQNMLEYGYADIPDDLLDEAAEEDARWKASKSQDG